MDKLTRQVAANAAESASASEEMRGPRKQSGNGHTGAQDQAAPLPAAAMKTDKPQPPVGINTEAGRAHKGVTRRASGDAKDFSDF